MLNHEKGSIELYLLAENVNVPDFIKIKNIWLSFYTVSLKYKSLYSGIKVFELEI